MCILKCRQRRNGVLGCEENWCHLWRRNFAKRCEIVFFIDLVLGKTGPVSDNIQWLVHATSASFLEYPYGYACIMLV